MIGAWPRGANVRTVSEGGLRARISKDPTFLRADHEAYARHLPHLPSDLRLHVEGQETAALARQVLTRLP